MSYLEKLNVLMHELSKQRKNCGMRYILKNIQKKKFNIVNVNSE